MIEKLRKVDKDGLNEVAKLLQSAFPWCYGEDETSLEEANSLLENDYVTLVYKEANKVVGIVSARPQYGLTGWELHPLVVDDNYRMKGIGKKLMASLEEAVASQGGVVICLGTDDEHFRTSLSKVDLFIDTFKHIESIKNLSNHPFTFYEKMGYKIVGVIPDANGPNKPDIFMAKRIVDVSNNKE
ncbi:MAG: GNAT family N-acetyltransferase [Candidatus Izemoplasmataceae bacterium]